MKTTKQILCLLCSLVCACGLSAQTITGKLTDEQNQPLPYANVVILSLPDSAFVNGTVSAEDGSFSLNATAPDQIIRITSVGYNTVYKPVQPADLGTVRLIPDTQLLNEVVIKGDLPRTRVKGDAMVTTVTGSILEKAGTGNDLLNKIPGVSAEEGSVNVFGSGAAEIYINGRKMRDASELEQLESNNIKSVEVVRNPGARYDASVAAVIRIFTKKPEGEGFGFNNRTGIYYRYNWSEVNQFNFNYRKGGFDLGGMIFGMDSRDEDNKKVIQETFLEKTWRQESDLSSWVHTQNLAAMLSLNYQFNEQHSLGMRYNYDYTPNNRWHIPPLPTTVYCDSERFEESSSSGWQDRLETRHDFNLYYNGQVKGLNIDFNADGLWQDMKNPQEMLERITSAEGGTQEQPVTSHNDEQNRLYAAKLVLSHPLWDGNVSLGSEFTHSSRKNLYVNTEGILDNDNSRINENAVSAFLEYSRNFGPLQAQAGVRYEHLASGYYEQGRRIDEQSRTYDNVFPSVSLSMPVGKAQVQLAYSGSINRPSYYMLRSNVTYINRYTYESGNPMLKPTLMNRLTLNTSYKWISLNVNYTHLRDGLLYQSTQYSAENPTISLVTFVNTYDTDRLYATLTLAPTIGIWSPQFSAMLLKQWFPVDTPDGQENFGHPMGNFSWNNHFTLPKGFQLDIDLQADTRGDNENSRMLEGAWRADVSLYKSFLNERLSLQLQGSDLFESSQARITLFSGNRLMTLDQETRRQFRLTVRYKFNAAKSKYKGTGAGQSQKNRM